MKILKKEINQYSDKLNLKKIKIKDIESAIRKVNMKKVYSDVLDNNLNSLINDLRYLNNCEKDEQIIKIMIDRTNNIIKNLKEYEEAYR